MKFDTRISLYSQIKADNRKIAVCITLYSLLKSKAIEHIHPPLMDFIGAYNRLRYSASHMAVPFFFSHAKRIPAKSASTSAAKTRYSSSRTNDLTRK